MVTFSDRFACSSEQFWALFLNPAYQRALHLEGMGFGRYDVQTASPDGWTVKVVPTALPGPVRKVLGDGGYTEVARRDGALWRFDITPDTLGDRIHTAGVIRIQADGGQTVRSVELDVQVRLLGVGRAVKKAMESMMQGHQQAATAFTHQAFADGRLFT